MNEPINPDVTTLERRERRLRFVTLFSMVLIAAAIVMTISVLIGSSWPEAGVGRTVLWAALGSAFLLTALLFAYVLHTHASLSSLRLLYEKQTVRDHLTGLLTRQAFPHRFEQEVERAKRYQRPLAILLCNLDRFNEINEAHGHQVGDEVLRLVAKSTLEATRGSDLVFRWGGDEFLVLLDVNVRPGVMTASRRIRKSVKEIAQDRGLPLDLSVGVALYPEHARDARKLIGLAERALRIAKKGGDKIHIGEEESEVSEKTVEVVFQPVVEIGSRDIIGYEALSQDPKGKTSIQRIFQRYSEIGQLEDLKRIIFRDQVRVAGERDLEKVFINIDFETLEGLDPFPKPENVEVVLEISEAELPLVGLTKLDSRNLGHRIGLVRRLESPGQQKSFIHRLVALPGIDARAPQVEQPLHPV